jgi:predicted RNase H-like HicB family nuclease
MNYAIVMEKVPNSNYCAYVPDLPGCVSAGDTLEEVERNINEAIEFHFGRNARGRVGNPRA